MRVELVHVIISRNQEDVVCSMDFPNAKTFRNKEIRAYVKQMAKKYSQSDDYEDTDENWYEFRYEKLSKISVPSGEWIVCMVEFLADKI